MTAMRVIWLAMAISGVLVGCGGETNIKASDVLDERTGTTMGALQTPLEFVQDPDSLGLSAARRAGFAYLGPIEWDRMGEISYGIWIHLAPGNDRPLGDLQVRGTVTLILDDGPLVLTPLASPNPITGPYKTVVSWGQTGYFEMDPDMLKRLAASKRFDIEIRSGDDSKIDFLPSHDTRGALRDFERTRGITDD